jgi:hypothetical protein
LSGILFIDFFLTTHMKRLCVAIFGVLFLFGTSFALPHFAEAKGGGSVHVNGYFKSNGTYVAPYMRSAPDSSPYNNYSYPGNTNQYTGKTATGDPATYIKNLYNHSGTSNSYTYPLTYPSTTITTSSPQVSVPANAHASPYSFDNGWLCDSGYKQTGNQCVKIIAYGECDQYGFAAEYNSLDNTCSCLPGWIFENTTFGKQCVSTSQYCRDQIGLMSNYDSLYKRCECVSGYVLKTDVVGNQSCVSGDSACQDQLGLYSTYQSFSDKCVCNSGYTIVSGKCVDLNEQCRNQLGLMSSYNTLYDTCQCISGYIIDGGQCKEANSVCSNKIGYHSSYNPFSKKCECDDEYTLNESGQCAEKQHNVYFNLINLDTDKSEAVIRSDDGTYYHISYGIGCLSIANYEHQQVVVNLGTDYSLDAWDTIVLQNDDETCNIVTKEQVDSSFNLNSGNEISVLPYVPVTGNSFEDDIANSPYKDAISNLKQKGVISGYSDGTYKPNNLINRAEFIKIVMGAVGTPPSGSNCYSDVKGEWFAGYTCSAKQQEIATGYPDGTFKPNNNINVVEALKIVLKAFAIPVRGVQQGEAWYTPYLEAANSKKFYLASFDSPEKKITRAEMAELVNRVMNFNSGQ